MISEASLATSVPAIPYNSTTFYLYIIIIKILLKDSIMGNKMQILFSKIKFGKIKYSN